MKKKLTTVGIMLLIGMSLVIGVKTYKKQSDFSSLTGYFLKASNGSELIIDSVNTPIVMINKTKDEKLFSNLKDGDQIKVKIKIDAIAETYPGQAGVYACEKIDEGSIEDIPQAAISELSELGWID